MDSLVQPAPAVAVPSGSALPIMLLVSRLRRYAVAIGLCALLGAAGAYMYTRALPKSYTASAAVAVEGDRIAIPELQGALKDDNAPDPMPLVHTEVQALYGRQLVEGVTSELHLERNPEFNAALRPPTLLDRVRGWFQGFLPASGAAPGTPTTGPSNDGLIGAVMHNLVISQDNRSLVIGIAFSAHDPALAARFVNTLIADYIEGRAQRRVAANQGANAAMNQRIDQVRADIERIEQQMRDLRRQSGQVGLPAGSVGQQQLQELATAASRATLDRSQIEANYERAQAMASGGSSDALASVLGSETISRLRGEESQAAAKVADLSQHYGPAYPALRSAQADLSATRREIVSETHRIVASLATQLRVARAHEADVQAQLKAAGQAGVTAQNTQAELDQLQQDAATRRDLYRTLLERAQQTVNQPTGTETPDVRVLSNAVPPGFPSAPNTKMAAGAGGAGGALLACMAVLAFTRRSVGSGAAAFAQEAGLAVAASLRARAAKSGLADRVVRDGEENDALRLARAALNQLSRTPPRVVGFVGGQAGASASSVAAAYARAVARDGQRVLLVDCDPNGNGGIGRALGAPGGRVAEVMTGAADWQDCLAADRVPGLQLLLGRREGGTAAPQPVGLENLLAEARGEYDHIVLGAPEAAQADAVTVVRSADVTVLVIEEAALKDAAEGASLVARLRGLSRSPLAAILLVS